MKYAWVLVVLAACGGGGSGDVDAGNDTGVTDAGEDGGSGLQPDALDPNGDLDGDGVLNGVDDCVTVADPAQFDLDGDGIGWMCDPLETKSFPLQAEFAGVALAVGDATMGGAITCTAPCTHTAFSVGPSGISIAQDPADTWVSNNVLRGYVPGDNHVLWSVVGGVIGDQNATGGFTPRVQDATLMYGQITVDWFVRDTLRVLTLAPYETGDPYQLIAPNADGTVTTVATSSNALLQPQIIGQTSPTLVFGISDATDKSVQQFEVGATSSHPLMSRTVVFDHLDDVAYVTRFATGGVYGFCARKDGKRYFIETNNGPLHIYEAPDGSCTVGVQQTSDHRFSMMDDTFYVLDGVGHTFTEGTKLTLRSYDTVPAVLTGEEPVSGGGVIYPVYAIDAAGEHVLSSSGGVGQEIAQRADTDHFVTFESGTAKLVRYRNGVTTKSDLPATGPDEIWKVFTTNEGAAIATTSVRAVAMASQSSTATVIDFDNVDLLVSAGVTFFVASHNASTSQPALYTYSEVGGMPHYTALTPEVNQATSFTMSIRPMPTFVPFAVMDQQPETGWFIYQKENDYCRLVRPVVMSGTVMLVGNYDCGDVFAGVTPDGKSVVLNTANPHVEVSDGMTFTTVAKGTALQLLYATPGSNLILGWYGFGVNGPFVCSASHPERCWTAPASLDDTFDELRWVPLDRAHPDALHIVLTTHVNDQMSFISMKTVGPGNTPQPLQ